jgi:hypothetical protein
LVSSAGPIKTPVGACATAVESIELGNLLCVIEFSLHDFFIWTEEEGGTHTMCDV